MYLTNQEIEHAKSRKQAYKLYDRNGLSIAVSPNGRKHFRLRYWFEGGQRELSLGPFPQITLRMAREVTHTVRSLLERGFDPSDCGI